MILINKHPRQIWLQFEAKLWEGILNCSYNLKSYSWKKIAQSTFDGTVSIYDQADYKVRTYEFCVKSG